MGDATLVPDGAGTRHATIFGIEVDVAGLDVPARTTEARAILRRGPPVILVMERDVDAETMANAIREGIRNAAGASADALAGELDAFVAWCRPRGRPAVARRLHYASAMDDWQEALTWALTLTLGFSLAACAGIRAWLPMLIAGLAARFTDQVELGESFRFLESTPALVVFGVATVIEIVGDKIPAVDHALDAAGTFIRPLAGALLSASVLYQVEDPLWALGIGLLVGAPTAAVPHAVKSATRGLSTSFTFGLANPLLSVVEDVTALVLAALAIVVPILMGFSVLVIGIVVLVVVVRQLRRAPAAAPAPAT